MLTNETAKPNFDVMKKFASELDINLGKAPRDKTIFKRLRATLDERMKEKSEEELYECETCGERTDDDAMFDEQCPFCGTRVDGVEETTIEVSAPETVDLENADDDIGDPEADAEPVSIAVVKSESAELVDVSAPTPDMKVELAKYKAKIVEATQTGAKAGYDLGVYLSEIRSRDLWKAEGHKTFKAFCESMNFTRDLAYKMIKITQTYDRDTYVNIGIRKLLLIESADTPEQKKNLLEDAKGGASVRELEEKKKPAKAAKPEEPKEKREPVENEADSITLLARVGAKPVMLPFLSREEGHAELKMWEEHAFVRVQLSEDVQQLIALRTNSKNEIVGVAIAYNRKEA